MTRTVDLVAPLVALAQAGIPTDIQELLVNGDPMRGIALGALDKAITAYLAAATPADVAGLVRELKQLGDPRNAGIAPSREAYRRAATVLSALSARPHPNETLERAAKALEARGGVFMRDAAAAVRKMKEPE